MTKRKLHLPASIKALGVLFALFFVFSSSSKASAADFGVSYFTCHYQSGTDLICPSPDKPNSKDPFEFCECLWYEGRCSKAVSQQCSYQEDCNKWMSYFNSPSNPHSIYGDCCGCSGKPKPLPLLPKPTPTSTLIVPSNQSTCYQACQADADCFGDLVCGYHLKAGQRVCHNPACAGETDCTCDWQNSRIQAAFSRLKAFSRKSQENNNQTSKNNIVGQISQSLSSGLERAWERLRNLKNRI